MSGINEHLVNIKQTLSKIFIYEDEFVIKDIGGVNKVKIKIIWVMIQIERPVVWSMERIIKIASQIKILSCITQP
jgi:hypothetical protein